MQAQAQAQAHKKFHYLKLILLDMYSILARCVKVYNTVKYNILITIIFL